MDESHPMNQPIQDNVINNSKGDINISLSRINWVWECEM